MKKILFAVLCVLSLLISGVPAAFAAPAAPPAVFFSDLTSGPKDGGKDNQGVFVTVVGKNFGSSQGDGYVTIGGGRAAAYPVWNDKKITFQLGASATTGDIIVNTGGGKSNGIHFTVRPGRIFFVDDTSLGDPGSGTYDDPWKSPKSFFQSYQPGDTCYFREGTYNGSYGTSGRPYNVSFYNSGRPGGAPDNEVAWVGYPGETALFKADGNGIESGAFELVGVEHHTIAGLSIYGKGDGKEQVRLYANNNKLVNCKIEGIKTLSYAMIGITASNLQIWGNECFGATSANKLDHIFYFQGGGSYDNVDIGWNWVHDNNIAVGPVFSWNMGSGTATNIRIHDNKIDCRKSSDALRLAGIWSGGGGSINFYNNLIIGSGASLNNDNSYNAIYVGFGTAHIYNNTFYRSTGAGNSHVINVYQGAEAVVKNNIFYNQSNCEYVNRDSGNLTLDSNAYFGGAGNVPSEDPHPITADPGFTNDIDMQLSPGSPVIDKGVDTTAAVLKDYDGIPRTAGRIDLGAREYYDGQSPAVADGGNGNIATAPSGMPAGVTVIGSAEGRGTVNPDKGETAQIYVRGSSRGDFKCMIFTLTGDLVWESSMANVQEGTFEWRPDSMASGIYLAHVTGPGLTANKKIAVLK